MNLRRQIVRAVTTGTMTQAQAARAYRVSPAIVSKLLRQWALEGDDAFHPKSRRPNSHPATTPAETVERIPAIRTQLIEQGLDAGPATILEHLRTHHPEQTLPSRATIARILSREGLVKAQPKKRPKSSLRRFEASLPNGCWQSDVTHLRLANSTTVDVITWLDDHSRACLHISAVESATVNTVVSTLTRTARTHGWPAATLTDNGAIYTSRYRGGINRFEKLLRAHHVEQRNGAGNHPQTQGKVERFQQTMKKWVEHRPAPATLEELQTLLDKFQVVYNTERVHSAKRSTPWAAYIRAPKDTPSTEPPEPVRFRADRIDKQGKVTLRYDTRLYSIGVGRTHARTRVVLIIKDRHIIIVNKTTGEVLKDFGLKAKKCVRDRALARTTTEQQANRLAPGA
ncbi:DDE-type integrase/transposase/recombinase [Brevibacterium jeotgali]|uniref:Helix-turn-helix domain-containing protein n=1 Tax=Brevibacterium jeotgali TaxID=1262550 RepID=A0A2H1L8B4_9MICO|nr:DDE-type integrase/transposase/recombinase [Brevibacterium jeotgali]TWC02728.1 helix-turn-helix protein [Brevibacterium jeotgali]SMY13112.1 Helix-turn-helix domain-containing protein [Brevibacterium jeotgali]